MDVGDLLKTMTVTGESPDGKIYARVYDYTTIQVSFRPWTFDDYDEPQLAFQLGRLGLTTWVNWSRERMDLYRESLGLTLAEAEQAQDVVYDAQRKRYEAELNAVEGAGVSAGGTMRIHTVGMMQWRVDIEPGSLRRYGEQPFLGEIHSAFESLMRDREMKIITLKSDYFDLGIPRRWRDLMTEAREVNRRAAS